MLPWRKRASQPPREQGGKRSGGPASASISHRSGCAGRFAAGATPTIPRQDRPWKSLRGGKLGCGDPLQTRANIRRSGSERHGLPR
eukprot:11695563-Alexandrium_andersonii.AAC.1